VNVFNNKRIVRPSMVAHTFNPSYLGGRDWEDHGMRLAPSKKCKTLPEK
jgi:hypothetical protein